jgi:hypothetical protein
MQIRVLLATNDPGASELSTTVAEVAAELAQRKNVAVTIESQPAAAHDRLDQLTAYHLVHVVGAPTASLLDLAQLSIPLVVTPTRQLRRAALFRARRAAAHMWWLVHGRTNAARLVTDGISPGSRVLPLPVLPYLDPQPTNWAAARAQSRAMLDVSPGQLVVVGFGPVSDPLCEAVRQLSEPCAHSVVPLWIAAGTGAGSSLIPARLPDSFHVVSEETGRELIPAMDVLVAGGSTYAMRTPAFDAASAGVPVISSATDIAADFVDPVQGGALLTNGTLSSLVSAVDDALQDGPRGRIRVPQIRPATWEDVLATTELCYVRALQRPLSCTRTLLRSTPR